MSQLVARRVTDRRRVQELGRLMGNCLATYGRDRLDGRDRIYEILRDGTPAYAVHVRDGRIVMFEGPGNRRPVPADVPLVRRLLRDTGALDATRAEAAEAVRREEERASIDPPRSARPRRRGAARPPRPRRGAQPRSGRQPPPAAGRTAPREPRPTWVSVQQLAADLLDPRSARPEWPEVAAGLWALGVLPRLCDPSELVWEPVIVDLAGEVATGELPVDRGSAVDLDVRLAAAEELRAAADRRTREGFQRLAMADLLAADLRP